MNSTKDTIIGRRVAWNTISNLVGKVVTLALGFFLTPFILGHLGQSQYGLWALVGSITAYSTLLDLGIAGAVIKYIAEFRAKGQIDQAHHLVATALRIYSLLGLVAVVLSLFLAPIFTSIFNIPVDQNAIAVSLVILSGITIGISIPCTLTLAILRGLQRFDIVSLISTTGSLLSLGGGAVVLALGGGVLGMAWTNLIAILLMQVVTLAWLRRNVPELNIGWGGGKMSMVRMIIGFSTSLFVINLSSRLQNRTDEMVIGAFLPVSQVTPYFIARRLSEIPQILADQFMKSLMPLASELHAEDDHQRLRALYLIGTRLTLVGFIPVALALVIQARQVLTVWVGEQYSSYTNLVAILLLACFLGTSQWPAGALLQGMAKQKILAYSSAGNGITNLALSILLVHSYGLVGVALGTLIPTIIENVFIILPYSMHILKVSISDALKEIWLPALLPAVPMALVLLAIVRYVDLTSWFSLLLSSITAGLVYFVTYLLFGSRQLEKRLIRVAVQNVLVHFDGIWKRSIK